MMRIIIMMVGLLTSALLAGAVDTKNPKKQDAAPLSIKVGDDAPDFALLAFDGKELKKVSLGDYRGKKNVAVAFYVFAFTGG